MKSRYLPKKKESPVKAIREMCIECMGGRENIGYKEINANCVSPYCALHDFRFGKNPYHGLSALQSGQRKASWDNSQKVIIPSELNKIPS